MRYYQLYETTNLQHGYGWWIHPDGRVEECEDAGGHADIAYAHLDSDGDGGEYVSAYLEHGAVRISTYHGSTNSAGIEFDAVTPAAKKTLQRLMPQLVNLYQEITFETGDPRVSFYGNDRLSIAKAMRSALARSTQI
jgi:hypothetical protein